MTSPPFLPYSAVRNIIRLIGRPMHAGRTGRRCGAGERRKGAARENVAREKHRGAAEEPPPAYRILRRLSSAA